MTRKTWVLEPIVRFVEAIYRATAVYPDEILLPIEAWAPLIDETDGICRVEEASGGKTSAIVLAQGTKIRLTPRVRHIRPATPKKGDAGE
jgi:hypothetical protein